MDQALISPRQLPWSRFEVLAERGVISRELAEDMRKSVGFRNIVVQNSEVVDWQVVFAICRHHLDQFRQFAEVFMDPLG
ncbi:type VII toxin-antitoxin system HepT family RNase toxin [Halomonas salipaludis]|uniref:type VII toxin-antitoxin system HepT family RNase toxin n=1 Tax=Halomonas salipaludis TaxID=2032625 RepID=UPI001E60C2B7|nr:DUF86 domain-containing protein [Halomonas salipaludis]